MTLSFHEIETASASLDLSVTVEGLVVTVGSGDFNCYGVLKSLTDLQECQVSSDVDQATYVQGWLVENGDGEVLVV